MSGGFGHWPLILNCAGAAATGAIAAASILPRSSLWCGVIHRGPIDGPPRVALTFDDGPTDSSTPRVLDTLGEHGVKAVFFVIGANAQRWPDIVRRMYDEGHVVANHSWDHAHFGLFRGGWYWDRQIGGTNQIIEQIIDQRPALFRPPMGVRTWCIAGAARRAGLGVVTWTRRGLDGITTTPEKICRRLGHAQRGDILVLHDGVEPNSRRSPEATVGALPGILRELKQRELEPVRLDEWLGIEAYAIGKVKGKR